MFTIHVVPKDIWSFVLGNSERLEKECVVVASDDSGAEICLSTAELDTYAIVYYDGKVLYSEKMINDCDAEETMARIYHDYLGVPDDLFDEYELTPEEEHQAMEDEIYEREDALFLAAVDFLTEILCIDEKDQKDADTVIHNKYDIEISTFIDSVLEMLATDFLVSVYRPTFIPDESAPDGEILDEFPYEELVNEAMDSAADKEEEKLEDDDEDDKK